MWNAEDACLLVDSSSFLSCELFRFVPGTGASTQYRRWLHARCIMAQRRQCRGCSRAVDGQDTAPKSSGMNVYHCSFLCPLSTFQVSKDANNKCHNTYFFKSELHFLWYSLNYGLSKLWTVPLWRMRCRLMFKCNQILRLKTSLRQTKVTTARNRMNQIQLNASECKC